MFVLLHQSALLILFFHDQVFGMTDDVRVTDVACGSSHSVAWAVDNRPQFPALLQPVPFPVEEDPLGISELGENFDLNSNFCRLKNAS